MPTENALEETAARPSTPLVIVTAAGHGRRFVERGFTKPKLLITLHHRPLLWWSLVGLRSHLHHCDIRVVVRHDQQSSDAILRVFDSLGLAAPEIVTLAAPTSGQAETCLKAIRAADADRQVVVWNVDTYLDFQGHSFPEGSWLSLFPATAPNLSYARTDGDRVLQVVEKEPISPWGSSGLYAFESADVFRRAFEDSYPPNRSLSMGESYVAPMYQTLIERGATVRAIYAQRGDVVPIGTPDELESAEANMALTKRAR